jgi:hypothetical protein
MKRPTKYDKLPEKQRELFDTINSMGVAEGLSDLFYWEAEGFGNYRISELISLLLDASQNLRRKHVAFTN